MKKPRVYDTLRRRKLLKNLESCDSIKEAAAKSHYAPTTRSYYKKATKDLITKHIHADPERIKDRFEHLSSEAEKVKDFTNALRGTENLARICGMFIDRTEIKSTVDINLVDRISRLKTIISSSDKIKNEAFTQSIENKQVKEKDNLT